MDRPSLPPPSFSASTSAIPRQSISSADTSAAAANPSPLQRGYSDGATAPSALLPDRDTFLREHSVGGDTAPRTERNAGSTGLRQPGDSAVVDRKRRLTTPENPERRGGYRSSTGEGSSQATAIDLTRSPDGSISSVARRDSDIMIPQWQPDSDVAQCPVCGTQFSFWYRKHHCRYGSLTLTSFRLGSLIVVLQEMRPRGLRQLLATSHYHSTSIHRASPGGAEIV